TVTRPDFKPYTRRITIEGKTETQVKVALVPTPSRSDAVVAYVVAGVFLGGGIFAGVEANDLHDELQKEIKSATPPASDDPRFLRGKIYSYAADGAFAVSVIAAATAVY